MKGLVAIVGALLVSLNLLGKTPADTTVTSFEIQLKRKADNALGFNTCTIDRMHLYNLVVKKLQQEFDSKNFRSLHNPMVLMKFADVTGKDHHPLKEVSASEKSSLSKYNYSYFIRIYGNLDIDQQINNHNKAIFTLRVFIFDSEGNLIKKCKSKSIDRDVIAFESQAENVIDEEFTLNEDQFFDLVTEAADSLELSI